MKSANEYLKFLLDQLSEKNVIDKIKRFNGIFETHDSIIMNSMSINKIKIEFIINKQIKRIQFRFKDYGKCEFELTNPFDISSNIELINFLDSENKNESDRLLSLMIFYVSTYQYYKNSKFKMSIFNEMNFLDDINALMPILDGFGKTKLYRDIFAKHGYIY